MSDVQEGLEDPSLYGIVYCLLSTAFLEDSLPDYFKDVNLQPYGYRIMSKIEFDAKGKPLG